MFPLVVVAGLLNASSLSAQVIKLATVAPDGALNGRADEFIYPVYTGAGGATYAYRGDPTYVALRSILAELARQGRTALLPALHVVRQPGGLTHPARCAQDQRPALAVVDLDVGLGHPSGLGQSGAAGGIGGGGDPRHAPRLVHLL